MGGLRLYMRRTTEVLSGLSARRNITVADFFLSAYDYRLILYICYFQLVTFTFNLTDTSSLTPAYYSTSPIFRLIHHLKQFIFFSLIISIVYTVNIIIMSESALQFYAGVLALK